MNTQEQQDLAQKLSQMRYNQAKNHLWALDKETRLRYYRSNQEVGKWLTAFDLPNYDVRVTLVEARHDTAKGVFVRMNYDLLEVRVEQLSTKKGAQGD